MKVLPEAYRAELPVLRALRRWAERPSTRAYGYPHYENALYDVMVPQLCASYDVNENAVYADMHGYLAGMLSLEH
jgi:hypothetical protein